MYVVDIKGHEGPVKGLRASGPQGPDPLFTHILMTHVAHRIVTQSDEAVCVDG